MPVHHIRLHIASTLSAQVMALGVSPDRIVYAHPCKPPKQIRWSATHGVNLTTFDTESELHKVGGLLALGSQTQDAAVEAADGPVVEQFAAPCTHAPALPLCTQFSLQMAQFHPTSGLLLRIRADDPAARCQLGNKVGSGCCACAAAAAAAAVLHCAAHLWLCLHLQCAQLP